MSHAPLSPSNDDPVHVSESEAEARDTALVAKARGWTVDEAEAQTAVAEAVGKTTKEIRRRSPGILVGSALNEKPGGPASIYLKGAATEATRAIVTSADAEINIVDGQPYSFDELQERVWAAHDAFMKAGYTDVVTAPEITTGKITVELGPHPVGLAASSDVLKTMPADLASDISVETSSEPITADEHAYGGMKMFGDVPCTSGWSVENSSGTTGVATAGHCIVREIREPYTGTYDLTHKKQHIGAWGDVEWKTTSHVEPAKFYADWDETRDVQSVEHWMDMSIGEPVCLYGRKTNNRDCSPEIKKVGVVCRDARSMVRTGPDAGESGDSGGGWSWGNRAYGLHKGNCGTNREGFSLASGLPNSLGVSVRTK